jgi:antitoxin (DNA-binding transcriptional repressor) of toxin-antitoxin stability system
MGKRGNKSDLTRDIDAFIKDIVEDGAAVIIEQEGEPVAALVPVQIYKHLRHAHEATHDEEGSRERGRRRGDFSDEADD